MAKKIGERLKHKGKGWIPYLVYALLALAVLGPLLQPGYTLTLDMVFIPNPDFVPSFYGISENLMSAASMPFDLLVQLLSYIMPVWLIEKVLLFLLLFLAGVGAHRLIPSNGVGSYFAGLLYMINPFTYVRLLAGQWQIVAGYALAPFAIKAFIDLLERGDKRDAIKVAVLSTLVGLVQIHWFFLLLLAYATILVVKLIKERGQPSALKRVGKYVGLSAVVSLGLNLYWLVPTLTATGTTLEQIGSQDMLAFAPRATSSLGVGFDIASMHGFWREGYTYAMDFLSWWWIFPIIIIFLAVYGLLSNLKHEKVGWVAISFALVGIIGFFLAMGAAGKFTGPPFEWLFDNVPFFKGFRDSQKFVALLCLAYAYLGGLGVSELVKMVRQQGKRLLRIGLTALIPLALLTPPIYGFTMFGFHGQLGVTDYPQEWYEVDEHLSQDGGDFNILFLPWHMYMDFSWLPNEDKRLGTWSSRFFDRYVISGDNMEMAGIYSQSINPISNYVEFLLDKGNDVDNLGELLAPLNVKYIIVVHEVDYESYDFLYHQDDLTVDLEKPGITLFKNEYPRDKLYGVDSVVYIEDLEEYLELSQSQDVMEHLYIVGNGSSSGEDSGMQRLDFVQKSAVRYWVNGSQAEYIIFTVPQIINTEQWEYNGKQPMKNLGFMPAFESAADEGEIVYTRFYNVYLLCYVISLVTLGFVVGYYVLRVTKRRSSRE